LLPSDRLGIYDGWFRFEIGRNFLIAPLNFEIVKTMPRIKLKEMHDKIVVATAQAYNCKLITKDEEIRKSGLVPTVWD
jgi:PIN domain nuclease of toxin-antitoxin system